MIQNAWNSNYEKCRLFMTITTGENKRVRIIAREYNKPNSKYADRQVTVNGQRKIFLSFPVSPKQTEVIVYNLDNPNDKDIKVEYDKRPLDAKGAWMDEEATDFSRLAILFSQTMGFVRAPRWYTSHDQYFKIKLMPTITDYMTGQNLTTPARIGHETGIIEASQERMLGFTIAARLIIMLHEFSHKYRNPKLGLPINSEIGADLNALYIYLGLGFSKVDAIYVYCNVFLKAQTPGNQQRMRAIMQYIEEFEKGNLVSPSRAISSVLG